MTECVEFEGPLLGFRNPSGECTNKDLSEKKEDAEDYIKNCDERKNFKVAWLVRWKVCPGVNKEETNEPVRKIPNFCNFIIWWKNINFEENTLTYFFTITFLLNFFLIRFYIS